MTALLPPFPKFYAADANGAPLAGGLLYTYAAGTTTPLATYTDSTGSVSNTNPVVLNSSGEANVWLTTGTAYKFVLEDQFGVVQWTVDQITGGIQGAAGTPGSVWRNGSGVPSNSLGIDGDYYLNDNNGDVYLRSSGAYAVVANILGPAGSSVNRIVNGRFWQSLTPWTANGTVPPTLGTGASANSGGVQQYAAQSISVAVTSDGSVSQAFSIQALSGTQNLTFKTACWLENTAAQNANTGFVKVYLFDGQNNTETLIGTYNFTASSSTPSWTLQTIDVTANLPIQGDYGLRFEIQSYTDNVGGAAGTKGTYTAVDDVQLVTSSAGVAGPTGPAGPQGPPGSSSGVLQRVTFASVGANTWTSPVSVNFADITCVAAGGGGGGGGNIGNAGGGGGGGAGAVVRRRVPITPNTAYTVTIGAKGLGSGAGSAGTNGGNTTFGSLVTALGGGGGGSTTTTAAGSAGAGGAGNLNGLGGGITPTLTGAPAWPVMNGVGAILGGVNGGAGGSGTTGANGANGASPETYSGGTGGLGSGTSPGPAGGGGGAASPFGAGGAGGAQAVAGTAAIAGAYGAGGGGGGGGNGTGGAGANGMDGYCIIEYVG